MKVYVVTSGSYSDYRIEEIFAEKGDAEALASVLSDGNDVDEWEVNQRKVVPLWSIWMKRDGDLDEQYGAPFAVAYGAPSVGPEGDGESIYCYDDDSIHFNILADSLKRAIKVANERRVIILSHNFWGDDGKIKELFS